MTPKLLPTTLILGCTALLAFAFILPSNTPQPAATAYAQSTPNVSFTQEEVQGKEGSTIYLKVKLDQPATKTTKVTIKLTPDEGTTSRDIPGLTGTKTVTFYKNGSTSKTVAIRTSRTTAEGDKSLTASITKVGNTTVQGDTARIVVKDQKSTGTILTGNQNNNTATTTPPTNCEQYAGVIPNEPRKVNVVQRSFPTVVYHPSYGLSSEGKRELDLMQGDIGYQLTFGAKGPGNWNTVTIPSGVAYAYKFKTTEYNYPVYYRLALGDRPATTGGVVVTSISLCPGDFSSPQVMAQTTGHDEYNTGNTVGDQKFRNCVTYGRPLNSGGGIEFGIGGNTQYICALEPNKTYYLNVSAGFAGGGDKGPTTPHIGTFDGTTAGTEMTADFTMYPFGHLQAVGNIGNKVWNTDLIKNRTAFYAEARRISGLFQAAGSQRTPEYTFQN